MDTEDENFIWEEGKAYGRYCGIDWVLDKIVLFYHKNKEEKDFAAKLFLYIKELRKDNDDYKRSEK